jgi:hypothetical protein
LSVDPLSSKFAMLTPYQFASNTPIWAIDVDGLEAAQINNGTETLVILIQGYNGINPRDGKTQAINDAKAHYEVDINGIAHVMNFVKDKPQIQLVVYSSSQSDNTKNDVLKTIENFKAINPNGRVILAGHSLGADNLVELVNEHQNIDVDLLITLDIADHWDDDNIPANVRKAINYYQTLSQPGGEQIEIDNTERTDGTNILAPNSTHTSIDNDMKDEVANQVMQEANKPAKGSQKMVIKKPESGAKKDNTNVGTGTGF